MGAASAIRRPAGATLALLVPLALLDRRMQETGGPGIIPFELAGPERSLEILRRWGPEGRRAAKASLVLDYPFLASYTALNVRLTRRAKTALELRGVTLPDVLPQIATIAQLVAGACDAVENVALLVAVAREGNIGMARLARLAARAKFASLALGWLYGATALYHVARRR